MLKKVYHIIIAVMLMLGTTGVTLSNHYCGNTLVSTSIIVHTKNCCNDCKSCHNESKRLKVVDNYNVPTFKADFDLKPITLNVIYCDLFTFHFEGNCSFNTSTFFTSPPVADNSPAFLQIFRC